ncbi:adenylate/guanylate cyclase domain-containing protein [Nitratireductor kimnyeongensis]|uniref:Adenylate/guanylate cyclase domain-containing protein n=1 Tax=Nitratireductor kimnyeongensis TaxID=430679 RepID=A0ABW0TFJ6_9HYPH|nr:adenylate/guanylate cyclase domain-containing protein [Nitratireductor kimnyeongensis]QZZ37217.1 adenylate/guanylate cyclase domain-containing protein [Nitratireductor kimnyeongensis]
MSEGQYTRQVTTIASIDAVGFSRLMGIDDAFAVAAFEERRSIIADSCDAAGGRTFGAAGDSIMAEFGTPIDALRAAFDFQSRIVDLNGQVPGDRRMPFRVGINTGNVIVRGASLYGDDVNIAARIQELAPTDGLAISETTWNHVRDKVAASFTDLGERQLKNIALPVRIFVASRGEGEQTQMVPHRTADPAAPPAVAVLPFQNEAGAREFDYIADGVAEDIIQGLCSTRWLPVIARESSFQFRDKALGARMTGSALGARYLVDGRLARGHAHFDLVITLTDASNERLVWTRGFRRPLDEVSLVNDEIGGQIVSMLEKEVERVEQARTFQVPWESLETWQLVRRARWHMQRRTREDTALAFDCLDEARRKAPNSSAVLNELAWWHFWRGWLRSGAGDDLDKVTDLSRKSLLMDSQDARPHANLGAVAIMRGQPKAAIEHLHEALQINPSFAFAHSAMGSAHLLLGEAGRAIPLLETARRLSPFDIYGFHNLGELAAACCFEERWDEAIAAAEASLGLSPRYFYARFLKIGALARCDRVDDARRERAIFNAYHPDFSLERVAWIPFAQKSATAFLIDNFNIANQEDGAPEPGPA